MTSARVDRTCVSRYRKRNDLELLSFVDEITGSLKLDDVDRLFELLSVSIMNVYLVNKARESLSILSSQTA